VPIILVVNQNATNTDHQDHGYSIQYCDDEFIDESGYNYESSLELFKLFYIPTNDLVA
jgi:hypothetical protein